MTFHVKPATRGIVAVRADAAGDTKTILANLQKDWTDYKAAVAEKDQDDVLTKAKIGRIEASVGDLQKSVDDANAKMAAAEINGGTEPVKDAEYTASFRSHFRKGEVNAALNKGADDEGGYLAPVEWDRTITDKLVEISPMRQIASVQTISSAGFKKLYNLRGAASGWVGETAVRPQTATPEFGSMTFTPGEIYANPAATQQMLDDSEVNLEAWLSSEVETEFALQEGLAFIAGNGVNKPFGFLTHATGGAAAATNPLGAIKVNTVADVAAISEDELLDTIYDLPAEFTGDARWVMNRSTMGAIRKLRDADGRQLWQPSTAAGQPSTLLNYAVTEMAGMPDLAAGAMPIAFGDFRRGYLIVDRTGVRVLRDPYTNKPYVMFYLCRAISRLYRMITMTWGRCGVPFSLVYRLDGIQSNQ